MKKIIFVTVLMVLITRCSKELDMSSLEFTPRLVVNAFVNTDDDFSVQVSSTIPITDSIPKYLPNAKVIIFDGSNSNVLLFDLGLNKFVGNFKPAAGKTYQVMVECPSFNAASGSLTLPQKVYSPKSTWIDKTGFDSLGFETGTMSCYIADPAFQRNYYEITLYRFDDFTQEFNIMQPITLDAMLNENGIKTDIGGILIDDKNFSGSTKKFEFITPYGSAGTQFKYLVAVRSLSDDFYRYLQSLDNYRANSGLFSDPSPVYSNVINGRGICAGASIQRDTIQ